MSVNTCKKGEKIKTWKQSKQGLNPVAAAQREENSVSAHGNFQTRTHREIRALRSVWKLWWGERLKVTVVLHRDAWHAFATSNTQRRTHTPTHTASLLCSQATCSCSRGESEIISGITQHRPATISLRLSPFLIRPRVCACLCVY